MSVASPTATASLGETLRWWRRARGMSQLDLASAALTTPRYMSFVETGRSQPSRDMVLRLATALGLPLRDSNSLLLTAGYAPVFAERPVDDPAMARVDLALSRMLDQQEPLPAVVMDRSWDLVRANGGAGRLFGAIFGPDPVPDRANVLRLFLEPGPVRDAIANWEVLAPALLERARREAVGGILDRATADLVGELQARPEVARALSSSRPGALVEPVVDVHLRVAGEQLRFFSIVSTLGTPVDVTAQELRLEAFFPADDRTAERWADAATGS